MSSYDDDEALFEDIYDDDKSTEVKKEETSTEASKTNELSDSENNTPNKPADALQQDSESSAPASIPPAPQVSGANDTQTATTTNDAGSSNNLTVDVTQGIPAHLQQQFLQFQQMQRLQQQQQQDQQQQQQPQFQQPSQGLPPQFPQHDGQQNLASSLPPPPPPPPSMAPSNMGKESGKMFIGGLNWDTDEDKLVEYFSKYGSVTDRTIMRDANTGRSRGFGFLTFEDPRSVDEVIKTDHILDGKLIDPKRAIAREEQDKVGKIFVGGIDPMVNEKDFSDFFSQFGHIIDAQLMIDKDTGRSRGFGFITYDSPDAVDRVTVNKYLTLKDKAMEVKRAEPRGQHQQNQNQNRNQAVQQNTYNPYNSPYANQYGQMPQAAGTSTDYSQNVNGMSPQMMQEYWQRMQQWYMYQNQQQQVAGAQDQPSDPNQAQGDLSEQQPLNPQQQAPIETQEPDPSSIRPHNIHSQAQSSSNNQSSSGNGSGNGPSNASGNGSSNGNGNGSSNGNGNGYGNNNNQLNNSQSNQNNGYSFREKRGFSNNVPRGPRRALPSGPSGRGRGGYQNRNRGGYHPYGKGGRRS